MGVIPIDLAKIIKRRNVELAASFAVGAFLGMFLFKRLYDQYATLSWIVERTGNAV